MVVFRPSGDCGLTVELGEGISRSLSAKVLALREAVEAHRLPGVVETVPTYRSLLVHYDPLESSQAALIDAIGPLVEELGQTTLQNAKTWQFPVCFDEDLAPDIAEVCAQTRLSKDQIAEAVTTVELVVYMLGFAPGLPYMGDLPESLNIPRKQNPSMGVPPGAVLIATGLSVIYPVGNPSGWWQIGQTPVRLFDKAASTPILLSPGDVVRYDPVDRARFDALAKEVADGRVWVPEGLSDRGAS